MKNTDIKLSDWNRILFGEAPITFLIEVLFRTLFIYFILLIVIKLMGKRMAGQLTISELAVMLTLGAIITVPTQIPQSGVLQGVILLFFVLGFQQALTVLMFKNKKLENITQGTASMLIKNGILQLKTMYKEGISKPQLFTQLRMKEIYNLGKVERMYHEGCGIFSTYTFETDRLGLSVLPKTDISIHSINQQPDHNMLVCTNCGTVKEKLVNLDIICTNCGHNNWDVAVK